MHYGQRTTIPARVLEAIGDGEATVKDIAERTGISISAVQNALQDMRDREVSKRRVGMQTLWSRK